MPTTAGALDFPVPTSSAPDGVVDTVPLGVVSMDRGVVSKVVVSMVEASEGVAVGVATRESAGDSNNDGESGTKFSEFNTASILLSPVT